MNKKNVITFFEALIDSVGRLFWLCNLQCFRWPWLWLFLGVQSPWTIWAYKRGPWLSNSALDAVYKCFTTVAKVMFFLVWSALWLWIISSHFRFTKLDQGETFIRGVTQYLVLKWFTTHLTSKECSECIHRSAFVNIYCSRRTLLPDSEYTDAVFYQQTKAHVCALWRHAAWPEGQFRCMTKQAWVLHEAQNGDLAFVPWLKTLFSPLLHFSSSLVPSLFFLYRHFLPAFLHGIPPPPLPPLS